jgi:7-carboxy-7-deazaguanine synthase (Cx14CxxC type)
MSYSVKEIYYTLQGEGAQTGRPAVFLRFAGCNLWSGHEKDRGSAVCPFCDTDFVGTDGPGGGRFSSAVDLARAVGAAWPGDSDARKEAEREKPLVVCTGGEPLLQLDEGAVTALHEEGFEVAVETNGTMEAPPGLDWICVSPKAGADLLQRHGHELKLVYPQEAAPPDSFEGLAFEHFFLQPMDGPRRAQNTKLAVEYCLAHPQWRLSLQTHKYLGID